MPLTKQKEYKPNDEKYMLHILIKPDNPISNGILKRRENRYFLIDFTPINVINPLICMWLMNCERIWEKERKWSNWGYVEIILIKEIENGVVFKFWKWKLIWKHPDEIYTSEKKIEE